MLRTVKQRAIFAIILTLLIPIVWGFLVSTSTGLVVLGTFIGYGIVVLVIMFIMRWIFGGEE